MNILSLGAGVQSTAVLLMSIKGLLPKIDHRVFADTQYEPPDVYKHLEWLKLESAKHGIPIHVVTAGNLKQEYLAGIKNDAKTRFASIPLFILNNDNSKGKLIRQCTAEYKIEPIEQFIKRNILGLKPKGKVPKGVYIEQWFGISSDETKRAKHPRRKKDNRPGRSEAIFWKSHAYPLIDQLRKWTVLGDSKIPIPITLPFHEYNNNMTRGDCITWLETNYPEIKVPRSACICCPYRSDAEWIKIREENKDFWEEAINFDYEIRKENRGLDGTPFIHSSLKPLDKVEFKNDIKNNDFTDECQGMCGN